MAQPQRTLSNRWIKALAAAGLGLGLAATPGYAKKSELPPAKVKQLKKARQSYDSCRKDALAKMKQGSANKKRLEADLNICKESWPGASLYADCKKESVKKGGGKGAGETCRQFLIAAQFDPAVAVPFFAHKDRLYFAGIGLNKSVSTVALNPPNFECERLKQTGLNLSGAQYILFGNHPRVFATLNEKKGKELTELLKFTKPNPEGVNTPGFGRIFGDPRTPSGTVFFPTAPCDFEAEPGDILAGMSAYYLVDTAGKLVTPYFGIAYYKGDQTKITTQKLIQSLTSSLGADFKAIKKNPTTTFVASSNVTETDDEQDPKNLCRQPRPHQLIGVVQGQKDNPSRPEYAVVANVRNLCDYGDRMSRNLTD